LLLLSVQNYGSTTKRYKTVKQIRPRHLSN